MGTTMGLMTPTPAELAEAGALAGAKKSGLQDEIDAFGQALPSLVAARNMLEHFDEYSAGTGWMQLKDPSLDHRVDITRNGESWLLQVGPHQIDVAQARAAANALSVAVLAYTNPKLQLGK